VEQHQQLPGTRYPAWTFFSRPALHSSTWGRPPRSWVGWPLPHGRGISDCADFDFVGLGALLVRSLRGDDGQLDTAIPSHAHEDDNTPDACNLTGTDMTRVGSMSPRCGAPIPEDDDR
jgi:hypothetical protein